MTDGVVARSPFQARDLAVPMADAVSFGPDADAARVKQELEAHKFDQAPIVDEGKPIGYVMTRWIEPKHSVVQEALRPLGSGNVVSADADVGDLLEWIILPGFLFVLEGRDVTGFITVHDFNKQPARGHFYLLLARLETALARLVRHHYGDRVGDCLEALSAASRTEVEANFERDRGDDVESDLVAYLTFADLITVVGRADGLLERLNGMSRNRWSDETGGLAGLRNQVMHPVRNVVLNKEGLEQLHRRERRIRRLIETVEGATHEVRT